ncbi:DUF445 domain-containing protein [uncultured Parasphingopyxis sp.]|uniref:DUF445 domain-containing protein n=1 Tax=uncultured Parasphingopyxis sp. TaxID=1547918 RepID=UPI00261DFB44|nr:DUF445 domain-containing protein [uncultured Parasphingopyxis sp.]
MTPIFRSGTDAAFSEDRARTMRRTATGMLVFMAGVFILAHSMEDRHMAWGFVAAFAEAAMVGGLADWFAVTALFRHPLGLPIPHTAIIPNNKDRIGDTLASFLKENFLTASVVARRMKRFDIASAIGRFLNQPDGDYGRIRQGASRLVVMILESLDDERLGQQAKAMVSDRMRKIDVSPLLGQALEAAVEDNRHVPIIDGMVRWAANILDSNEAVVRQMVYERANNIMRWLAIDDRLSDAIINGLRKLLIQMESDPHHPLRDKANEGFVRLAFDMQHDPKMQERVNRIKDDILANPAVTEWIDGLWENARGAMLRAARDPDRIMQGRLGDALRDLGRTLQDDKDLNRTVNTFARRATVGAVADYGDGMVKLVSDTVRGWDAETVTGRVENAVGRDLQYIRVNGTLVGGLVGLTIHTIITFT